MVICDGSRQTRPVDMSDSSLCLLLHSAAVCFLGSGPEEVGEGDI